MEEEGGMNSLPTKERANLYIQIMAFLWKVELYVPVHVRSPGSYFGDMWSH